MNVKNVAIPNLNGKDSDQKIQALLEYVIQLQKQVNYTLGNLDTDNMTKSVADVISNAVDQASVGIDSVISDDTYTSAFKQLAHKITLMVTRDGVVSAINLYDGEVKIQGSKIELTGAISANDNVTIGVDGKLTAIGLTANNGTFNIFNLGGDVYYTRNFQIGAFELGEGWAAGLRWNPGIATEWGVYEDTYGNPNIKANDYLYVSAATALYLTAPTTYLDNNAYIQGNCSAKSFTDRTPAYTGDALKALAYVKADNKNNIDHTSLPTEARKKIQRKVKGKNGKKDITSEEDGRDIGMMISILTKAIQQLTEMTTDLQNQINNLKMPLV